MMDLVSVLKRVMLEMEVQSLHGDLVTKAKGTTSIRLELVVTEAMVVQRFTECQKWFQDNGMPSDVTLGYRFTDSVNMRSIRQHGLQTRAEQKRNRTKSSRTGGATFGNGIYLGNNPDAFSGYGDVGLFVAIL
mmetsp:Transcript_13666/g.31764  ORF Transcript_13666/g.31764 Transcript_13666/m.31764 type:complete len:133 (-) Transcript_13666:341-739(-)